MRRLPFLVSLALLLAPSIALACPYSSDCGSSCSVGGGSYLLAFLVGAAGGLGSLAFRRHP
jgi:hypothetical protein